MPENFLEQLTDVFELLESQGGHGFLITLLSMSGICYYLLPLTITIFLLGILFFKNFK